MIGTRRGSRQQAACWSGCRVACAWNCACHRLHRNGIPYSKREYAFHLFRVRRTGRIEYRNFFRMIFGHATSRVRHCLRWPNYPAQSKLPIAFGISRTCPDQRDNPTDKRPAEGKIDNKDCDLRIMLATKRDDCRHKVQCNEADNYPEHQQYKPSVCLVIHCRIDP